MVSLNNFTFNSFILCLISHEGHSVLLPNLLPNLKEHRKYNILIAFLVLGVILITMVKKIDSNNVIKASLQKVL